jgi:nucleoside-triphosphatase THEP1
VKLLADIVQWVSPQPANAERIFWVTGIPGSGKSTLSATIVENLRKKHTPVSAQFFISRNIPESVDPDKIIPTIAQQLAISSPTAARVLEKNLRDGYPAMREEQVASLLLAPIRELSKSHDVVVILIDALDELKDADRSVIEILSHIAPIDCDLPNNVRFIITSRPEHWADISGSKILKQAVFKQHFLATKSSVAEVHSFIVGRMREIVARRMELTPNEPDWHHWPDPDQLLRLSARANGLFHYAATALRWIEEQIQRYGKPWRSKVFDLFDQLGIGQLNDLYRLVLTAWEDVDVPAEDEETRRDQLDGFHHVIGTILVLQEPLAIRQIIALLSDIPEDKFEVANFLQQMRSVLIPGTTGSFEQATPQMHKSFRDYIMNGHAPADFQILTRSAHFMIARSCLEVIVKAGSQPGLDHSYAGNYWHGHLRQAVEEGNPCDDMRMWELLGGMMKDKVVHVWSHGNWLRLGMFMNVAAAGWFMFKVRANQHVAALMAHYPEEV